MRPYTAADVLESMAATYRERNATYKNNWAQMGDLFLALYPEGVTLRTAEEFTSFHLLGWALGKITRHVNAGDIDSIHDAAVYLAMVESLIINKEIQDAQQG